MDWEALVALVVPTVFIVTVGGVIVLRPIAKRFGTLLDAMARERSGAPPEEIRRLGEAVATVNDRLTLLEERLDFTERLIGPRASRGTGPAGGEESR